MPNLQKFQLTEMHYNSGVLYYPGDILEIDLEKEKPGKSWVPYNGQTVDAPEEPEDKTPKTMNEAQTGVRAADKDVLKAKK